MPLIKKLQVFAAKIETTPGTAIALANADGAYNAYDIKIDPNIAVTLRETGGGFGRQTGVPGPYPGSMSFKTDLAWSGTGLPAWASTLLPACGYVESSQVFTPTSEAPGTNVKTVTIGVYDGRKKFLAGAVGNFKITFPNADMVTIEWEFQGVWQEPIDATILTPTHPDDTAARFGEATLTYNSVTQCVENVVFDAGNVITRLQCPTSKAGYKYAVITDRMPKLTLSPEAQLVADEDKFGDFIAANEYAFSCVATGASDSTFTLAAPKAQITSMSDADREGILVDDIELACNKNGTTQDEEVSLTFTDAT
jgi:hypothetical protein